MYPRTNRAVGARATCAVLLLLLLTSPCHAHALLHEVVDGEAVILRLSFPGADRPSFQPYEVLGPGAEGPFQSGRTNALGELSFRPDRPGSWRVRVFTEDGHGATIDLEVDATGSIASLQGPHGNEHHYWTRVLAALGYLLGAFGLLVMWRGRRARPRPA